MAKDRFRIQFLHRSKIPTITLKLSELPSPMSLFDANSTQVLRSGEFFELNENMSQVLFQETLLRLSPPLSNKSQQKNQARGNFYWKLFTFTLFKHNLSIFSILMHIILKLLENSSTKVKDTKDFLRQNVNDQNATDSQWSIFKINFFLIVPLTNEKKNIVLHKCANDKLFKAQDFDVTGLDLSLIFSR